METLKIAVQKKGRLHEGTMKLLRSCGLSVSNGPGKLKAVATNFPAEILFLRDDDIPQYVQDGVADLGIVGENELLEKDKQVQLIERLGFSKCRLSLAIPREAEYEGLAWFEGKKIATSYPRITASFLADNGVSAATEEIGGSVEIAPGIGLAEGICDLVSTGSTLLTNGLKEVETVLRSEAVMVACKELSPAKQEVLDKLRFRINSVRTAGNNKYVLLNAPNDKIEVISNMLPGMKSPTVMPLAEAGWSSMHSVIGEDVFWEVIDQLKDAGAQGILIVPIEKMVV